MPRLLHHISARYPAAMGCGLFFVCYRVLVIWQWTKNAKYEYCCQVNSIYIQEDNEHN